MIRYPNIIDCIPQRPPFVMVDRLVNVSDSTVETSFKILPTNVLCNKGVFTGAGLVENIAQTTAAGDGYRQRSGKGNPKIGFIGAVKKLIIHEQPNVGEELLTRVKTISSFNNALIVEGTVKRKGTIIATCQMNIFIIDQPKPFQS